jgi:hypothetical protein
MKKFIVNVGITIEVEAEDGYEAEKLAFEIVEEDWGLTFAREAWFTDPEEKYLGS